jgi:hypothetical protein
MAIDQTTRNEVREAVLRIVTEHPGIQASAILYTLEQRMPNLSGRVNLYRPVDAALQYHRQAGRIRHDFQRRGWFPVAEGSK